MKKSLEQLKPLIAAVRLGSLSLVESQSRLGTRVPDDVSELDMNVSWSARPVTRDKNGFSLHIEFRAILSEGASDSESTTIVATFSISYFIDGDINPTEEDLNQFARLNGVFNAWPYWREYLQSTMGRMGLTPFTLPLYRIGTRSVATARSSVDASVTSTDQGLKSQEN